MSTLETEVECEGTGEIIRLYLMTEQYQRAANDREYLHQLMNEFRMQETQPEPVQTIESEPTYEWAIPEQDGNCDENSSFIWTNSAVLLLLSLYEDKAAEFNVKRHKRVWEDIAKLMKDTNASSNVSGLQCQTKLNGLQRTYKKIIDHNNTSGNDRASCPFFERMHEIFGASRWAQPLAVASERGPFPSTSLENQENCPPTRPPTSVQPPKKHKLDSLLEKHFDEMKNQYEKRREERQERFQKIMEMKEKHHKEKLTLLKEFLNKKP